MIPAIPISWVKTYTYMAYVSMVGVFAAVCGGILLIIHCFMTISNGKQAHEDVVVFDIMQVFSYLGIAMFIFEKNAIIINLRAQA